MKSFLKFLLVANIAIVLSFSIMGVGITNVHANEEKITVPIHTHWWLEEGAGGFLREVKAAFEKEYPNIIIVPVGIPFAEVYDQAFLKLPTQSPPGIIMSDVGHIGPFIATGLLTPLNKYVEKDGLLDRIQPSAIESVKGKDGNLYMIPWQLTCEALTYNKEILDSVGVKVPTTLEELLHVARVTTNQEKRQYGIGLLTTPSGGRLYNKVWAFVRGLEGNFFVGGQPTLNTPKVIEAIELYKQFVDEGLTPIGVDERDLRELFAQGKIAMQVDLPILQDIARKLNPKMANNLGIASMPTPNHRGSLLITTSFFIPKNFAYPDAAYKWLAFIHRPEWVRRFIEISGVATSSVEPVPEDILSKLPWLEDYQKQSPYSETSIPEGLAVHFTEIKNIVMNYIQEALQGREPVKDVMDRAQNELKQKVDSWNK